MKTAPQTLPEALAVIRAMHHDLLAFRYPEFDLIKEGREGEFDDRVKAVLAHSAPVIKADRSIEAGDVARLNSGGPNMLVRSIAGGLCDCHWLGDSGEEYSGVFVLESMTLVHKGPVLNAASRATNSLTAPSVTLADVEAAIANDLQTTTNTQTHEEHRRNLELVAMDALSFAVNGLDAAEALAAGRAMRAAIDGMLGLPMSHEVPHDPR